MIDFDKLNQIVFKGKDDWKHVGLPTEKKFKEACKKYGIPWKDLLASLNQLPEHTTEVVVDVDVFLASLAARAGKCRNCGGEIKVAIFRGTEFCSDNCRKAFGKDIV